MNRNLIGREKFLMSRHSQIVRGENLQRFNQAKS